jgi:hypothetical protein
MTLAQWCHLCPIFAYSNTITVTMWRQLLGGGSAIIKVVDGWGGFGGIYFQLCCILIVQL